MTKIKISFKTVKLNEPMMLFWSLIPLIMLIVTTNYLFNFEPAVLGTSTESEEIVTDNNLNEAIKESNNSYKLNGKGIVTIVFAGATKSQFEEGYSYLEQKNMTAVVSAPTSEINKIESKMSWLNLRLLQHQGWEIISQSRDQVCDKEKLKDQSILDSEIVGSKKDLTEHGLYVNTYLAPCGLSSGQILNTVKGSYDSFMGFGVLANIPSQQSKYNLVGRNINNDVEVEEVKKWIKDANLYNQWLILVIPDINDNNDAYSVSNDKFKAVIDEISISKNQIATIGQVIKY